MENAKPVNSTFKKIAIASALAIAAVWTIALSQSANAKGAVAVAARAAPVSVARSYSAPSYSAPARSTSVRSTPTRRNHAAPTAVNPAMMPKSGKNCNLEQNKKLKECQRKSK